METPSRVRESPTSLGSGPPPHIFPGVISSTSPRMFLATYHRLCGLEIIYSSGIARPSLHAPLNETLTNKGVTTYFQECWRGCSDGAIRYDHPFQHVLGIWQDCRECWLEDCHHHSSRRLKFVGMETPRISGTHHQGYLQDAHSVEDWHRVTGHNLSTQIHFAAP
jgi:hypothetical protein